MNMKLKEKPLEVEHLMNTEEIIKALFCSSSTLYNNTLRGMPVVKCKGKKYYDLVACQRWYRGEDVIGGKNDKSTNI